MNGIQAVAASSGSEFSGLDIPLPMLNYVDGGGNPDVYTSAAFKQGLADNQAAKGKVEAISSLREALISKITSSS